MEFFLCVTCSAVAMIAGPCWDDKIMDLLFIAYVLFISYEIEIYFQVVIHFNIVQIQEKQDVQ